MNLYYDLPHDVRGVIDKRVKDMENRDALLNELKAFDRVAWSEQRYKMGKFPYPNGEYNTGIKMLNKLELFYKHGERQQEENDLFCHYAPPNLTAYVPILHAGYKILNLNEFFIHEDIEKWRERNGY